MTKNYNKLVRNNVTIILDKQGLKYSSRKLDDEEYHRELKIKLQEEVTDFLISENCEKLADVMEVIVHLADYNNISMEEIELYRQEKEKHRGSFKNKIFLKHIIEE